MKVSLPNFVKRGGLVTVVAQDLKTKQVLMVASTDIAGYLETLLTGNAVYYSTSRKGRWMKGETSGDFQKVKAITIDCDGDSLIYFVEQLGEGPCHTKAKTCFFRQVLHNFPVMAVPNITEKESLKLIHAQIHPELQDMNAALMSVYRKTQ